MRHAVCDGDFFQRVTCGSCGEPSARKILSRMGPERIVGAVDTGRSTRRRSASDGSRGRSFPADDERPRQPVGVRASGRRVRRRQPVHRLPEPARRAAGLVADRLSIFTPTACLCPRTTDTASPRRAGRCSACWCRLAVGAAVVRGVRGPRSHPHPYRLRAKVRSHTGMRPMRHAVDRSTSHIDLSTSVGRSTVVGMTTLQNRPNTGLLCHRRAELRCRGGAPA